MAHNTKVTIETENDKITIESQDFQHIEDFEQEIDDKLTQMLVQGKLNPRY